ncbi:carbamoyltransferase N-terminal domain-containing protein [Nonomuraea sp. NPDC050786]|uniref:carbamoyltransferase N-terminal domain-containing protein n=1 Tax=Nonomuraea sp. NPDC050786 TaxID=3154840 RepID=UPI0033F1F677
MTKTDLVFSGGCALNSHHNGRLAQEAGFNTLFIAPAPHFDGTALGAALYCWHPQLRQPRLPTPVDADWEPTPGPIPQTAIPAGYRLITDRTHSPRRWAARNRPPI